MTIDIKILEWSEVDLDELAALTFASYKASPVWVDGQTLELFRNYLTRGKERWPESLVVAGYQEKNLVGWLAIILEDPLLFELWRWHPVILPVSEPALIAKQLLTRCVEISKEKGAQSLEVTCNFEKHQLTPEVENHYLRHLAWYEDIGLRKSDESVFLTCETSKIQLSDNPMGSGPFKISPYQPRYKERMYECFVQAFSSGQDRTFQEKTSEQRQTWFERYLTENHNPQASMVMLDGDNVQGFSLVQTRQAVDDEHLALIAVSPECQRQGWGRILLSASIQAGARQGAELFSIGVDLANEKAYKLYRSMGFEIQSKLINHVWKNEL